MAEDKRATDTWLERHSTYTTVQLASPILVHGEEVSELRIRKPRARDLRTGEEGKADDDTRMQIIIARCADIPLVAVGLLELEDYAACGKALQGLGFTGKTAASEPEPSPGSPAIGTTSSA